MSSDAFDYRLNPELCTFTRVITGSPNFTDQSDVHIITTFEITTEKSSFCEHPKESLSEVVQGFKITSTIQPNIVEIQFYGQYFCITVDALRASWAGRSILFRHWYWIPLLRTVFEAGLSIFPLLPTKFEPIDRAFRLRDTYKGYFIGGSCCCRGIKPSDQELKECWEGGILLAEVDGSWKRFEEHVQRCFATLLYKWVGRRNFERLRKIIHAPAIGHRRYYSTMEVREGGNGDEGEATLCDERY